MVYLKVPVPMVPRISVASLPICSKIKQRRSLLESDGTPAPFIPCSSSSSTQPSHSNTASSSAMRPDKFFFYSRSKDVRPGRGVNEWITDPGLYESLQAIPDWRRVLSNFHIAPFVYDGFTFNSIEHAFQAAKIRLANPELAFRFTVESGTEIGLGDGVIAQQNRQVAFLDSAQIQHWDSIKDEVMKAAAYEKYASCELARKVLLATGSAELWHGVPRGKPVRFLHLEEIREYLRAREDAEASAEL
ncbi:uncharacterized protein BJ171DRAFT_499534 [Polychytrium aggregatum]|uniref:uncharacterized protein n=1 Tax=Polychytrium aggregatum TaxID=110093 RepID=UPI0022FE29EF|nr:uncharacterized protein BJ171DRAFT_499534 [Polychytrium aggregatum]KAI9205751.1 hypothetical protein BJ171DRAFT_499534 [Polychytrium aggregatum]